MCAYDVIFLINSHFSFVQLWKLYDSPALSGNDISRNSCCSTLLHNSFMWQLRIEIENLRAWWLIFVSNVCDTHFERHRMVISQTHFSGLFLAPQPKYFVNMAFVRYRSETICCFCCSFFLSLSPLLLATRQETFKTPVAHTTTEVQRKTEEITSACCISEKKTHILFGASRGDSGEMGFFLRLSKEIA